MSRWTHIHFIAEVRTDEYDSRTALKEQVEEEIGVPFSDFITGSEENAEVIVHVPIHNDVSELHNGKTTHLWDRAYICCFGHLRDRTQKETEKEVKNFEWYLKRHFRGIRNITYAIYKDGEELNYWRGEE